MENSFQGPPYQLVLAFIIIIVCYVVALVTRRREEVAGRKPKIPSRQLESRDVEVHASPPSSASSQSPLIIYTPPKRPSYAQPRAVESLAYKYATSADLAEIEVDEALRLFDFNEYIIFHDLIIPTGKSDVTLTQIDHVIVSVYGILCIETKSHHGNIYGSSRTESWKQYLGNDQKFSINSPYRQNMHHVRSLERFLRDHLHAPVHSYVAFPNARKVVVDGHVEDMSVAGVVRKIAHHTHRIYELREVERIAKSLAHLSSKREDLRGRHIDEVKKYVAEKVAVSAR